jgi:hypothetical protein
LEEWEAARGRLNQDASSFDHPAKAQLNDLNKASDSLRNARNQGKLTDDEYMRGVNSIYNQAQGFKWVHHRQAPGSQIGDIIDDNGIQKIRTPNGIDVLGYSPEYIKRNTIPVGNGSMAVPTSPKSGYQIVPQNEGWNRSLADERAATEDAYKKIGERYSQIREARMQGLTTTDEIGNVMSVRPFTEAEEAEMNMQAGSLYVKQYMQAKHAARLLADDGIDDPNQAGIKGRTSDPFVSDFQQATQAELAKQTASAFRSRTLPPPAPSMTPLPEGPVGGFGGEGIAGTDEAINSATIGQQVENALERKRLVDAANAAQMQSVWPGAKPGEFSTPETAAELPIVRPDASWPTKLAQASLLSKPVMAGSKEEFNTTFKDAPEGLVVELADGRKYIRDKGKFWQVPAGQPLMDMIRQTERSRAGGYSNPAEAQADISEYQSRDDLPPAMQAETSPRALPQGWEGAGQAAQAAEAAGGKQTKTVKLPEAKLTQSPELAKRMERSGKTKQTKEEAKQIGMDVRTKGDNWMYDKEISRKAKKPIVAATAADMKKAPDRTVIVDPSGKLVFKIGNAFYELQGGALEGQQAAVSNMYTSAGF